MTTPYRHHFRDAPKRHATRLLRGMAASMLLVLLVVALPWALWHFIGPRARGMNTTTTTRSCVRAEPMLRPTASKRSTLLGATAAAGYLLSVVAANTASVHWPPLTIGGLLVPAGTLFAGTCLTARDLLHDVLGTRGVVTGVLAGAALSAVLASPQIAMACVAAFTVSEVLDTLVYAKLRRRSRLGAVAASNAIGLVIDSALFVPLAFDDLAAVPGQITGKTAITIATLALLHAVDVMRRDARP